MTDPSIDDLLNDINSIPTKKGKKKGGNATEPKEQPNEQPKETQPPEEEKKRPRLR
jgi:hypothetical protein